MDLRHETARIPVLSRDVRRNRYAAFCRKQIVVARQNDIKLVARITLVVPGKSTHVLVAFVRTVARVHVIDDAALRRTIDPPDALASAAPHLIVVRESVIGVHGIVIRLPFFKDVAVLVHDRHVIVARDDRGLHVLLGDVLAVVIVRPADRLRITLRGRPVIQILNVVLHPVADVVMRLPGLPVLSKSRLGIELDHIVT